MFWKNFGKYKLVYRLLWQTFGDGWCERAAFGLRLVYIIILRVLQPILTSVMLASIARTDYDRAGLFALYFVLCSVVIATLTSVIGYVGMRTENPAYSRAGQAYFDKLMALDIKYFNDNMAGFLTTATRQYLDGQMDLVRKIRDRYMTTLLSVMLPIGVICYVNLKIGIVVFVLGSIQLGCLLIASHIHGPLRRKSRDEFRRNSGFISDMVSNIVAVKAVGKNNELSETMRKNMKREADVFTERFTQLAKIKGVRETITVVFFSVFFFMIISGLRGGSLEIAGAILIVNYLLTILTGIYDISDHLEEHDTLVDNILPALEVLELHNSIQDPEQPKPLTHAKGALTLQDVSFNYQEADGAAEVLKGVNITIPAGQKLGVVGLSGAGKSTLARLLMRFEDVKSGSILLDGNDIREYAQQDLRRSMAYVPQEPLLFHDSIEANIRFAKADASQKDIAHAVKVAHVQEFVSELPQGLQSVVGERGVKLSGGQKQRVAIARAVLQDAPVIILDEATSALDSESEQIIKSSFKTILKGKTAIVVAHRLSTLSDMDRIIVLDKGKVIEDGTHQELVQHDGLYARLWKRQQALGI